MLLEADQQPQTGKPKAQKILQRVTSLNKLRTFRFDQNVRECFLQPPNVSKCFLEEIEMDEYPLELS